VVVGAYGHRGTGAAYVYSLNNPIGNKNTLSWDQESRLTGSDVGENSYFGYAVTMNNDTIYVGAYRSEQQSLVGAGAVYVFDRNRKGMYVQTHKLTSFTPAGHEYFGCAVASSGVFTLIGAYGGNDGGRGTNSGLVYVFVNHDKTTYTDVARLYATDASTYDLFGSSVALHKYVAVIGAHGDDEAAGTASGSAYVFRYNTKSLTWSQEVKLRGSDTSDYDYFGYAVSVFDGIILVGAYLANGYSSSSGAVYVFKYGTYTQGTLKMNGWYETTKFSPVDGKESTYFGYSLSLYKNTAIVGADMGDGFVVDSGSAYVFTPTTDYSKGDVRYNEETEKSSKKSSYSIIGEGTLSTATIELFGGSAFFICFVMIVIMVALLYRRDVRTHVIEVPVDSRHGLLGGTAMDVSENWHHSTSRNSDKKKKKKSSPSKSYDSDIV